MRNLTATQDAYGKMIWDHHHGQGGYEVDERDDGFVGFSCDAGYFAPYEEWAPHQREGIAFARGRVLDVGSGAGRVALHLQGQGHEVTAVDVSPLALEVCRLRGVRDARLLSITQVDGRLGTFDTIVMYGNNFGLFGNPRRARWLLRRWRGFTGEGAAIIAEVVDPYATANPGHLAYQERNRRRGRMSGQLRLRVRYQTYATPWFDYLFVSREEMQAIVAGTGWRIARFLDSGGAQYVAVIEKE